MEITMELGRNREKIGEVHDKVRAVEGRVTCPDSATSRKCGRDVSQISSGMNYVRRNMFGAEIACEAARGMFQVVSV